MARLFNGSSQYASYEVGNFSITNEPITMACWAVCNVTAGIDTVMQVGSNDEDSYYRLFFYGTGAGDPIGAQSLKVGVSNAFAETTTGYSQSTLHHIAGVFASDISRSVYIDGGSKGISTTEVVLSVTNPTAAIGALKPTGVATDFLDGTAAECGIWNVVLTDAEVAGLALGYSPLLIRPQSLVAYWPLIGRTSPEIDLVGGYDMTLVNAPTTAAHPPVMYPVSPQMFRPPPPAGIAALNLNHSPGNLAAWKTGVRIVSA